MHSGQQQQHQQQQHHHQHGNEHHHPEAWSRGPLSDDTVHNLRHRLNVMKDIFCDSDDDLSALTGGGGGLGGDGGGLSDLDEAVAAAKRKARRRNKRNCMDTIIDGTFMGLVLAGCLTMVLGAAFFAYKNLYHAVMKKMYPEV